MNAIVPGVVLVTGLLLGSDGVSRQVPLTTARQLTRLPNPQLRPTNDEPFPSFRSPELLIESNRTGAQQIYIVDLLGNLKRSVTADRGVDDTPSWSHDGKSISYVSTRKGLVGIYSIDANGSHERQLASGLDYYHPMWSPDDRLIMYNARSKWNADVYELWVMRRDGTDKHQLTHYGLSETTYGSWSPDGKRIAFRRKFPPTRSQIFVAMADGSSAHNLSKNNFYDGWPSWSPHGTQIVFASNRLEADRASLNEEIFLMNADGSDVRLVSESGGRNVEPRFSPDGHSIYFSHCTRKACEVYVATLPHRN